MNYNIDTDVNESKFDDIKCYNEITDVETINNLLGELIVLDRYKGNFDYILDRTVDVVSLCYNNLDKEGNKLQNMLVKFKTSIDSSTTYTVKLRCFMMTLVYIKPVIQYIEYINIDDFIVDGYITKKRRKQIENNIAKTLSEFGKSTYEIKSTMTKTGLDMKEILLIFSHADMTIFTAENMFLDHYRDSEIIRDINNTEYPSTMQTKDIVNANKEKYKILVKEMKARNNPVFVVDKYTQVTKPKQIEEQYFNFSQIPDGREIVPVIMNGNGFRAGYHDIPAMYAAGIAARVPDIMNEDHMGTSGYFARNMWMLTYGTISKTVFDCGSKNPIPVVIDEVELEMKDGRYYSESKHSNRLRVFHKDDTHLLGKTLWFRSPCTCNLKEDCCHICYGTKAMKVGELEGGFIYTTQLLTKDVTQKILSAKHILKADAERIIISDNYEEFFDIENLTLVPSSDHHEKFDIYIREDYMESSDQSLTIYVDRKMIPITISNYSIIGIPEKIQNKFTTVDIDGISYYKINSNTITEIGEPLVDIIPINIMMTEKYFAIMELFERKIGKYEKIEDAVKDLTHLVYGLLPMLSVHGEIIIGHLVRSIDNNMLRPNWLVEDQQYQLMCLGTALLNHDSATIGLSYEKVKHHVVDAIFDRRNTINVVGARSFEDYLFGEERI